MPLRTDFRFVHATRIAAIATAFVTLLIMSGCWVFSIQPLFDGATDPDLIFDDGLVGSWGHSNEGCQWILSIAANARTYDMTMSPGSGCKSDEKTTRYLTYLVKVGNRRFLDISPKQTDICDLCLAVHTFALVSLENDTLSVTPFDGDWLNQSIKEKKVAVTHVGGDGGDLDITLNAKPAELKSLLATYAGNNAAFKPNNRLVFTRK